MRSSDVRRRSDTHSEGIGRDLGRPGDGTQQGAAWEAWRCLSRSGKELISRSVSSMVICVLASRENAVDNRRRAAK
jgi:hypothetical protein